MFVRIWQWKQSGLTCRNGAAASSVSLSWLCPSLRFSALSGSLGSFVEVANGLPRAHGDLLAQGRAAERERLKLLPILVLPEVLPEARDGSLPIQL